MDLPTRIREESKVRCVWLRTKAMYLPIPPEGTPVNPLSTAIWSCLRTGEALGPDARPACDGDCDRPGRSCYEGPVLL